MRIDLVTYILLIFIRITNGIEIVRRIERDSPRYFTQGLFFIRDEYLIESTGGYNGGSNIHYINIKDGSIIPNISYTLDDEYFGEGCAVLGELIYELTWKNKMVFVFNKELNLENSFILPSGGPREGWGLTTDGEYFYATDGSSYIYKILPDNWTTVAKYSVTNLNGPIQHLNELEYANGYIYANIFQTNYILKLTLLGQVQQVYDLGQLADINFLAVKSQYFDRYNDVLNGIAYHQPTATFYVTGKRWNYLFQIKFDSE